MRMAAAVLAALALPAAAEDVPNCMDASGVRMGPGPVGGRTGWIASFAENRVTNLFDRWTMRHCRTGLWVSVVGFTPLPYPYDVGPPAEVEETAESLAVYEAIRHAVADREIPAGQRGADEVMARLREKGVEAETGLDNETSCVCDPAWAH
jgi:hypothetical protein